MARRPIRTICRRAVDAADTQGVWVRLPTQTQLHLDCPSPAVATENRIRAGADAAMSYPGFGMIALLKLLGGLLLGLFRVGMQLRVGVGRSR